MELNGILLRLPDAVKTLADVPEDFDFPLVHAPEAIDAALARLFPGQRHSVGSFHYYDGATRLDLSYDESDDVETIGFHFEGPDGVMLLVRICDAFGVSPIDNLTGDVADLAIAGQA